MSSESAKRTSPPNSKKQEFSTLEIDALLSPLSPEVRKENRETENMELERNIIIKLDRLTPNQIADISNDVKSYVLKLNEMYPDSPYLSKENPYPMETTEYPNLSDYSSSSTINNSNRSVSKSLKTSSRVTKKFYHVENIVSINHMKGNPTFRVKWLGYCESVNTWEPLDHLRQHELLKPFLEQKYLEIKEDYDALKEEMLLSVDLSMPDTPKKFQKLLNSIKNLDEDLLKADMIVLTLIKNNKFRYPKSMYNRAFKNLNIKHFKDMRMEQIQKISDWSIMVKEKEPLVNINIINDVDFDAPPQDFVYITRNVAGEGVVIPDTPVISCTCEDGCNIRSKCCGKLMESEFAYKYDGVLRLSIGNAIYECNSKCTCPPNCLNRKTQQGSKHKLVIFKTRDGRGWGVRTEKYIKKGDFLCEYTGEVITSDEAERRGLEYDNAGLTYLYDLDFHNINNNDNSASYSLDSIKHGNIARFINHSCDPNLGAYSVFSDCQDSNLHKICLFSIKPIFKGEELTLDYRNNGQTHNENNNSSFNNREKYECKCGAPKCRGFIF